jgi:hypothetical protein
MENLYYNLSEQEFSKSRKILLWIFAGSFFLIGVWILIDSIILGDKSIYPPLSIAPFGIGIFAGIIAYMASFLKKNHFFVIDDEKIEFSFGLIKPVKKLFRWTDIKEVHLPHKEKKVMLVFYDGSFFVINLTWIEKKKSSHIRRHVFYVAKEKNLNVIKVEILGKK